MKTDRHYYTKLQININTDKCYIRLRINMKTDKHYYTKLQININTDKRHNIRLRINMKIDKQDFLSTLVLTNINRLDSGSTEIFTYVSILNISQQKY